jgi:UDP-N-acetylglucosamine 2-epimerase (non-hydrolysing)
MLKKILVVFGTRPEAIKLAPVIAALRAQPGQFETSVCSSGQHREMLVQALATFGIRPDIDLDVMRSDQTLPDLTAQLVTSLSETIARTRPDRVIVQGDTTTAFAAALAAYYAQAPVAHVEAGLRSRNRYNPFPEEINRRLISAIADIHFAPTESAAVALASEGISPVSVHITGNTIVDALLMLKARLDGPEGIGLVSPFIRRIVADTRRLVLVTCHRRENFGEDLAAICRALKRIALAHPDHHIVFPVHLNPNVRTQVMPMLEGIPNISLLEPVSYPEMMYMMSRAVLVLSDSGGLQEEAPSFGVPVLVLRKTTERPEAIKAGIAELVGADEQLIVDRTAAWLSQPGARGRLQVANPYGDGRASERIVEILARTP